MMTTRPSTHWLVWSTRRKHLLTVVLDAVAEDQALDRR
jgi:hypothetical protein